MVSALRMATVFSATLMFAIPLIVRATSYEAANHPNHDDVAVLLKELSKTPHAADAHAAIVDLQYEAAYCSSFYTVFYAGAVQAGAKAEDINKFHSAAQEALRLTFVLARKIGMSETALEAQDKIDTQSIKNEMHGTWVNAPVVIEKHGPTCKTLLERPDARLAYWLRTERKNGDRARHRR